MEASLLRLALITVLLINASAAAQTPGFWLTGLAPGTTGGGVQGLSLSGAVAVGATGNSDITPGFSWTRPGGRYDFGLEPGMPGRTPAVGCSSDGDTIVGRMIGTGLPYRAYRRVGSGLPQSLGVLPGTLYSYASGVSGDGSIVVGKAEQNLTAFTPGEAFRWTQATGMQGLGYLRPDGHSSRANAISRDGSTIVGMSKSNGSGGITEAFKWTEATGMVALPHLGGPPFIGTEAFACSANGAIVVGVSPHPTNGNDRAVRWTGTTVEDLGILPGLVHSRAFAADDSGAVVGGVANAGPQAFAFVWTETGGIALLSDYLTTFGIGQPANYRLEYIWDISGDGLTFAGSARNLLTNSVEGFVATVPSPATAAVLLAPIIAPRRRRT